MLCSLRRTSATPFPGTGTETEARWATTLAPKNPVGIGCPIPMGSHSKVPPTRFSQAVYHRSLSSDALRSNRSTDNIFYLY
jgi:hypothetical protein